MQAPPPSVPFVEYVLKAIEHPPFMFVAKLAACCTMLFLTRSDPELLRTLCFKWAIRFHRDRTKLIAIIRRRSQVCKAEERDVVAPSDGEEGGRLSQRQHTCSSGDGDYARDTNGKWRSEGEDADEEEDGCDGGGGWRLCNPDEAVEHFLKILNSLVSMYFSWNWHRTDYVIQINKEYEAYVRENILPICIATPAEDGLDDEEETPWLLSPSEYLSGGSSSVGNFYSPVARREPQILSTSTAAATAADGTVAQNGPSQQRRETNHTAVPLPATGAATEADAAGGDTNAASVHFAESSTSLVGSPKFASEEEVNAVVACTQEDEQSVSGSDVGGGDESVPARPHGAQAAKTNAANPNVLLSFVTLSNFREALDANTTGLVIVFHAKYSAKSNEVLEVFQQIIRKKLLDPMPDIAVVYTVAEPELAALYNVSWFPTIIYTPPPPRNLHHPQQQQQQQQQRVATAEENAADTPARSPTESNEKAEASPAVARVAEASKPHCPSPTSTPTREDAKDVETRRVGARTAIGAGGGGVSGLAASTSSKTSVATKRSTSSNLGVTGTPVTVPAGPSPTEVLYGFSVEKEKPCASPMGVKLSPTARSIQQQHQQQQQQQLYSMASSPAASQTTGTEASIIGKSGSNAVKDNATLPGEWDGRSRGGNSSQFANENQAITHSPSSSSFSMLAEHSVDAAAEELEEYIAHDGHQVFPINGVVSLASLVDWVSSKGRAPPKIKRIKDFVTRVSALRAEQKYKKFRELHSAVVMLRRLQNRGARACASPDAHSNTNGNGPQSGGPRRVDGRVNDRPMGSSPTLPSTNASGGVNEPPMFIFLGGGMAAGKSTAAMALAHSAWWRNHKDESVLVNADEFKVTQPAFDGLQAELHTKSTRAAESLLVQAVNQGRSIVFDGTMMWAPFVLQVIDMIRKAHTHLFKQGAGYRGPGKPEEYFLPSVVRPTPLPSPYHIRFLGITVEPEIAVPRGFLRKFSTGRGVPIAEQLRSFKMFAESFPLYASLVDAATLYNNNVFVDLDNGELPPVIAEQDRERTGGTLKVYDEAAYQLFMKQKTLNEAADNILELYPGPSPTSSASPVYAGIATD